VSPEDNYTITILPNNGRWRIRCSFTSRAEANQNQEHRSLGAAFLSLNVNGAAYQEQHMKANKLISPEKFYIVIG